MCGLNHVYLPPCFLVALIVVRAQNSQLSDCTHHVVPVLDLFLLYQLVRQRPQKQFVMLRVTRRQILDVRVKTADGLYHDTHVVSIVPYLCPGLDILQSQWGQVMCEL